MHRAFDTADLTITPPKGRITMIDNLESITAKICAFSRAQHSDIEGGIIFNDYLAYDILGPEEYESIGQMIEGRFSPEAHHPGNSFDHSRVEEELRTYISPITLPRAEFAEKSLQDFMEQHEQCQYVICGAGMDTYSFRNQNPNLQIYELDHPNTQTYKLAQLNKLRWEIPENVHYVPIDFSKDNMTRKLRRAGFDPRIPTFITIMGVTYYLTLEVFAETLRKFSKIAAPGSEIVFDYPDDHSFGLLQNSERYLRLRQITTGLGEIMKQGFTPEEMEEVLLRYGFSVKEHLQPAQIQQLMVSGEGHTHVAYENIHLLRGIKKMSDPN